MCHQRHSYFQAAAKRSARLVRMYSAIDRSSAESAHQEMGVAAISKRLHEGVTQYHAQIGASVPMAQLSRLEAKLMQEASKACYAQQWEEALNMFTHALAVSEKTKSSTDAGTRGTYVHNIGFCLHCLGEFEAAKAYYEQSIECLEKVEVPLGQKILNGVLYPERLVFEAMYGGLTKNRIAMTRERIVDTEFGRKPDLKVLDGYGRRKPMPGTKHNPMSGRSESLDPGRPAESLSAQWEREGLPPRALAREGAGGGGGAANGPSWLQAVEAREGEEEEERVEPRDEPRDAAGGGGADRDAAEEEAARKEWLEYYLKVRAVITTVTLTPTLTRT